MTCKVDLKLIGGLQQSELDVLGLGDLEKIKYHNVFYQILRYRYCDDIVVLTIGAFTKYLHNEIFDK